MDHHLSTTHDPIIPRPRQLLCALLIIGVLVATGAIAPAMAADATACRVVNQRTTETYAALQPAVDVAEPGDQMVVIGRCRGKTTIDKDLTIERAADVSEGTTILDGQGKRRPVTIESGVAVTLRALTIRNGKASRGGGIRNLGDLTLEDVLVRGSSADYGGGAWNEAGATLTLTGTTRIRGNQAGGYGGGIMNLGSVRLADDSAIRDNRVGSKRQWADFRGGGVFNDGTLVLGGSSTIAGNRAREGGGVANTGTVALGEDSSITDNEARQSGGGLWNDHEGTVTLHDSSTIRGNDGGYMGGGAENYGTILLHGTSSLVDNVATRPYGTGTMCGPAAGELGGGVDNRGALVLEDDSRISGNRSRFGGGVMNLGLLTLAGSSTIGGNRAKSLGGGVYNEHGQAWLWLAYDPGPPVPYTSCPVGTLVMRDDSSISGNTAREAGGGVHAVPATYEGVVCGPEAGANVRDNAPDDCAGPSAD